MRIQAIRVSIVDQNGNRWPGTKSLDYFKYDEETSKKVFEYLKQRAPVNFYEQLYTKNEILQNLNTNLTRSTVPDYTQRKEIVLLTENAFKTFHGPKSVPGALRKYFLEEITEEYFIEMYLEKLGFNYEEEVKKLANDPDYFKNIYLLVEPIAYFRISSYRGGNLDFRIKYVGTITEVAHMMTKDKDVGYTGSDNFFGLVHPTQTYRGYNFGRTPMGDGYPLAIYVDVNSSMTVAGL
ncbi:MAG: hypothetical protein GX190_03900, partial [Mollicutes bacterium]|nr:hypothetical protein [Mollicutes bacterium]